MRMIYFNVLSMFTTPIFIYKKKILGYGNVRGTFNFSIFKQLWKLYFWMFFKCSKQTFFALRMCLLGYVNIRGTFHSTILKTLWKRSIVITEESYWTQFWTNSENIQTKSQRCSENIVLKTCFLSTLWEQECLHSISIILRMFHPNIYITFKKQVIENYGKVPF